MAKLVDPELLKCIKAIVSNWNVTDYVTSNDEALQWAGKNLANFTLKSLAKLMNDHVLAGGEIDQVSETRAEWTDWPFHYTFACLGLEERCILKPFWWTMIQKILTYAS
jgi:hypothetical protein